MKKNIFCIIVVLFLAGCANQRDSYYWGSYEQVIYDMYQKHGSAAPETQINILTKDIQKASSLGLASPPGVHAHLGMMYMAVGNSQQALEEFSVEMLLYPESTYFVESMIKRFEGKKK